MVRSTALLLWAQLLSLVGSQPPLLTMDPPWTPQFKGQRVNLTCGDPSVSISTNWYKNWRPWKHTWSNHLHVTLSDKGKHRFQCRTRGSELSPAVNVTISDEWLLLQVPAQAVLEGDALSLHCTAKKNTKISEVLFFHGKELLQDGLGDKLLLSPAKQQHSGLYRCSAYVHSFFPGRSDSPQSDLVVRELFSVPELRVEGPQEPPEGSALTLLCSTRGNALRSHLSLRYLFYQDWLMVAGPQSDPQHRVSELLLSHSGSYSCRVQMGGVQKHSNSIAITVRRVPVAGVSLQAQPPGAQVLEGDRLVLSCSAAEGSGPLSFSWYRQSRTRALGTGPRYELPVTQLGDSDHYRCTASNGISTASSPQLLVTVTRVPVAGVSLQAQPPGAQVLEGDRLVLSCSAAEGSGPLSFSWYRQNRTRALGTGPRYELPVTQPGDSDHYRCTASNGISTASSPQLLVTVVAPVSNASITAVGMEEVGEELVGTEGEGLTLSCSVRTGTEPVGFAWLRDGREMSTGSTWHLGVLGPEHEGSYQCVASNRLGSRLVFRARSPEVQLVVKQRGWEQRRARAVAVGLTASLLVFLAFVALLGWRFWRRRHSAATKSQHRDPTAPPGPSAPPVLSTEPSEPEYSNVLLGTPSAEDVLYSTVTITEHRGGLSPSLWGHSAPEEATVTYAALPTPSSTALGPQRPPSDSYENISYK